MKSCEELFDFMENIFLVNKVVFQNRIREFWNQILNTAVDSVV